MGIVANSGLEKSEVVMSSSYLVGWSAISTLNFSTPDYKTDEKPAIEKSVVKA